MCASWCRDILLFKRHARDDWTDELSGMSVGQPSYNPNTTYDDASAAESEWTNDVATSNPIGRQDQT